MHFWKGHATPSTKGPDHLASHKSTHSVPVSPKELKWALDTPALTTQYKSFYFTFEDGSAGYFQFAYGNLGLLVKVAPMGWTYYVAGQDAIVGSQTLHASNMKISSDSYSVTIGNHSLSMRPDHSGWSAVIKDAAITYKLEFNIKSECYEGYDMGTLSATRRIRHRIIPTVEVSGTVHALGQGRQVQGCGTYIEAFFTHTKFTDLVQRFANFQLRSADSRRILTLLHYIPRGLSEEYQICQGSYTEDGKVVAVLNDNRILTGDTVKHSNSGYMIPTRSEIAWSGSTLDGRSFQSSLTLALREPSSVTDVLAIFPSFFKEIIKIWAGLPFVFCWRTPNSIATISIEGQKLELRGTSNLELTFVHPE